MMNGRGQQISSWDLPDFWEIVRSTGARATPPTMRFIEDWVELVRTNSPHGVSTNGRCEELVRCQEIKVKGVHARLTNRSMLEAWGGDSGSQQLSYRWSITRGYAEEIVSARGA
jgi:hypothetical protein